MSFDPLHLAELHLDLLYERDAAGRILRSRDPDVVAPLLHVLRTKKAYRWSLAASFEVLSSFSVADGDAVLRHGPVYAFPETLPPSTAEILSATPTPTVLELAWLNGTQPHQHPIAVIRNAAGEVVSLCHSARLTPRAAEAGVETATAHRGQGYAVAVVSAWAAAVRASGREPVYSTQSYNLASKSVASKLGLIEFATDFLFTA